jgi:hypothetical protein
VWAAVLCVLASGGRTIIASVCVRARMVQRVLQPAFRVVLLQRLKANSEPSALGLRSPAPYSRKECDNTPERAHILELESDPASTVGHPKVATTQACQ